METSATSGVVLKAYHAHRLSEVVAVVIDPAAYSDQKSGSSNASYLEYDFYELLKTTISEVLLENAVPVRALDNEGWSEVARVRRFKDASLDFSKTVSSLLRENDANLFITIGGYFDQMSNTYQFDISLVDSAGISFQSSHMEFKDQAIQDRDDVVVRDSFEAWFDENFERSSTSE